MKKLMFSLIVMCGFAFGQSTNAPSTTTSTSAKTNHYVQMNHDDMKSDSKKAGKEKTVKGCIHKDGDNFWLKTRAGSYHLMSKDDLTAHDGHEVKATGMASRGPLPGDSSGKKVKHLEVSNLEMVSEKCKMGTRKSHKK